MEMLALLYVAVMLVAVVWLIVVSAANLVNTGEWAFTSITFLIALVLVLLLLSYVDVGVSVQ